MAQNNYTIGIPAEKPHYKKAFIILHLIASELKTVQLQQSRIETERNERDKMSELFADIHFFLITLGNLRKLLKEMSILLDTDTEYKMIYDEYSPKLDKIGLVRNHLEHILDGRLEGLGHKGKPLEEPNMFGNLFGEEYNFGGDKVHLKETYQMIDELETNLKLWNKTSQVYPMW